mgnify:CR=1 FL=1
MEDRYKELREQYLLICPGGQGEDCGSKEGADFYNCPFLVRASINNSDTPYLGKCRLLMEMEEERQRGPGFKCVCKQCNNEFYGPGRCPVCGMYGARKGGGIDDKAAVVADRP